MLPACSNVGEEGEVPPVRRTAALAPALVLLCLLVGCPRDKGDSLEDQSAPVSADLSHVKVGQKYHYHMVKKGKDLDMVWAVDAISATEVKYTMRMRAGKNPWVEPVSLTWPIPAPRSPSDRVQADATPVVTVQAGGRSWDCWIRDLNEGKRKTWIPQKNGLGTFPPYVKQTMGGKVTAELLKIE